MRLRVAIALVVAGVFSCAARVTVASDSVLLRCNVAKGYGQWSVSTQDGINLPRQHDSSIAYTHAPLTGCTLSWRAECSDEWSLLVGDSVSVSVRQHEIEDYAGSATALTVTLQHNNDCVSAEVTSGFSTSGPNSWQLSVAGDVMTLSVGNRHYNEALRLPLTPGPQSADGQCPLILANRGRKPLLVTDVFMTRRADRTPQPVDPAGYARALSHPSDPREGLWKVLDTEYDDSRLRPGGDYAVVLCADSEGGYDIALHSGAAVNPSMWRPGTAKGYLAGTPFDDIFDVMWIDAEGFPLTRGVKAQFESDHLLTLQFPHHGCTLRLQRVPRTSH